MTTTASVNQNTSNSGSDKNILDKKKMEISTFRSSNQLNRVVCKKDLVARFEYARHLGSDKWRSLFFALIENDLIYKKKNSIIMTELNHFLENRIIDVSSFFNNFHNYDVPNYVLNSFQLLKEKIDKLDLYKNDECSTQNKIE